MTAPAIVHQPRIGSLFSGYGGLDMAVAAVTGGETVWVSDIDKGACKILAHRYGHVPNLGDIAQIEWADIEPIDILTGGFPCQDLSHAGKRAGLKEGTRSGLWSVMAQAINQLRPRLVVAENVRGLLSAAAPSVVEPCPWCVGDGPTTDLRALGVVLADLADLGYDAQWVGLRAADVGACHGRFRVFLVAHPQGNQQRESSVSRPVRDESRTGARRGAAVIELLRTPTAQLAVNGGSQHPDKRKLGGHGPTLADEIEHLLPTPAVNDMGAGKTVDDWDAWTDRMKEAHGNGNGHGKSLSIEAQRLLPTPTRRDHKDHTIRREPHRPDDTDTLARALTQFGDYASAIARWEIALGRPAPDPTEPTGKGGSHRLSPRFVEWMMGLPNGWVTDTPGLTRNEALKALGNGVVPQQAATALHHMLGQQAAA